VNKCIYHVDIVVLSLPAELGFQRSVVIVAAYLMWTWSGATRGGA